MRIGVIGLGLIGGSIAKRLMQSGDFSLLGFDSLPGARSAAEQAGISLASIEEISELCEVVFVATPPNSIAAIIEEVLNLGEAKVLDTSSVKSFIWKELEDLPDDLRKRYLSAHPMAGSEQNGFRASREDLLTKATWAVSGDPSLETFLTFATLVKEFSGGIVPCLAEEHDKAVALSSHAIQVLHSTLAAIIYDKGDLPLFLSGPALRDTTRLADSHLEGLWEEILEKNKKEVLLALKEISEEIDKLQTGDFRDVWRYAGLGRQRLLQARWEERRFHEASVPLSSWWSSLIELRTVISDPRVEDFLLIFKRV